MEYLIQQIALMLLTVFVIALLIGWLISYKLVGGRKKPDQLEAALVSRTKELELANERIEALERKIQN